MKSTSLLRGNNARAFMNYLKGIEIPFTMAVSNYTVDFKAEGIKKKFVYSMQSNRAFASFAKLKSDLKTKPIPEIDKDKLTYFVHDFKKDTQHEFVTNIDLKSAYATVLYTDGYISRNTFEYICAGTKQERLASVGMLASKKQVFEFDRGKIISVNEITSDTANYFFYAVKRTSEIMNEMQGICGPRYLFTWVDGIYFQPDYNTKKECEAYIESIGHKCSVDTLKDFKVKVSKKQVSVDFKKLVKDEWVNKPFNLPLPNSEFKRLIVEAILSKKKK